MANTFFTMENAAGKHPVTYGFYNLVVRQCGKSNYRANKLFWDARDKQNPPAYIRKKLKNGWLTDTVEMDYNKKQMEAWIDQVIFKKKIPAKKPVDIQKDKPPEAIGAVLAEALKAL